MKVRLLGVGMGPQHVTAEVAHALRSCDYVVASRKAHDDELFAIRQAICDEHGVELVAVTDPVRDREPVDYPATVSAWHDARAAAYAEVIGARRGTAAFLVWGDPSLYDSTIRVVDRVAASLEAEWDVLPGVSTPSVLAARHRIVLHEVGHPVHITSARRLPEALVAGQTNIVVMLGNADDLATLDSLGDWWIWWGANLGTVAEELVSGRVADVLPELQDARARAKQSAGWVMDAYLLRGPR
ncbi:precorrin-6A synthase (deacetylating) [Nocardioides sp.]|uniref:precorrin-6A synthase (deacetylating) n=1 Tax=Nocardioides sp. TaxID=35761 RepID=UPI002B936028|nr:precorrin-6A synthase (deacetylating) [Nocardioides sp.]HXH79441.1 precorrin-6A synthase (deacetylating) [Nocardioides sp.]